MRPLAIAGNVNLDLVLGPANVWPLLGTEVVVEQNELRVGGAAGNTALALKTLKDGYEAFFDWARERNIAITLDAGWPRGGWTSSNRDQVLQWLANSRIALLNDIEARSLTSADDTDAAALAIPQHMPEGSVAIIGRGPQGSIGIDRGGRTYRVNAPPEPVTDTVGAGNIFNAGVFAAMADRAELKACLAQGVATASQSISTNPRSYKY